MKKQDVHLWPTLGYAFELSFGQGENVRKRNVQNWPELPKNLISLLVVLNSNALTALEMRTPVIQATSTDYLLQISDVAQRNISTQKRISLDDFKLRPGLRDKSSDYEETNEDIDAISHKALAYRTNFHDKWPDLSQEVLATPGEPLPDESNPIVGLISLREDRTEIGSRFDEMQKRPSQSEAVIGAKQLCELRCLVLSKGTGDSLQGRFKALQLPNRCSIARWQRPQCQ